jgi:APA family basic amino acid/polyamine antiporter
MVVNWIFVANLTPDMAIVVMDYETTGATLGHVVTHNLIGETGGKLMSLLAVLSFVSAMSAMLMIGPRVSAQMAKDGYLPRVLARSYRGAPLSAIILQAALAIGVLSLHSLREALESVGATLVLFSALSALGLVVQRRKRSVSAIGQLSAIIYCSASALLLYVALRDRPHLLYWIVGVMGVGGLMYYATRFAITRSDS